MVLLRGGGGGRKRGGGPPPPAPVAAGLRRRRPGATARAAGQGTGAASRRRIRHAPAAADALGGDRRGSAARRERRSRRRRSVALPRSPRQPAPRLRRRPRARAHAATGAAADRPGALPVVRDDHDGDAGAAVGLLLVRATAARGDRRREVGASLLPRFPLTGAMNAPPPVRDRANPAAPHAAGGGRDAARRSRGSSPFAPAPRCASGAIRRSARSSSASRASAACTRRCKFDGGQLARARRDVEQRHVGRRARASRPARGRRCRRARRSASGRSSSAVQLEA